MRRSGAGGSGGGESRPDRDTAEGNLVPVFRPVAGTTVPPDLASAPPPGDDLGVLLVPPSASATALGVWAVALRGSVIPGARFEGTSAEGRALAYAAWVRAEIRAGRYGARVPRGTCALGHPCDRDRAHVLRLSDLSAAALSQLALCETHGAEVLPGSPPPPDRRPVPPVGRRRKAV